MQAASGALTALGAKLIMVVMKSTKAIRLSLGQFFARLIACVLSMLIIAPPPSKYLG